MGDVLKVFENMASGTDGEAIRRFIDACRDALYKDPQNETLLNDTWNILSRSTGFGGRWALGEKAQEYLKEMIFHFGPERPELAKAYESLLVEAAERRARGDAEHEKSAARYERIIGREGDLVVERSESEYQKILEKIESRTQVDLQEATAAAKEQASEKKIVESYLRHYLRNGSKAVNKIIDSAFSDLDAATRSASGTDDLVETTLFKRVGQQEMAAMLVIDKLAGATEPQERVWACSISRLIAHASKESLISGITPEIVENIRSLVVEDWPKASDYILDALFTRAPELKHLNGSEERKLEQAGKAARKRIASKKGRASENTKS